MEEELENKEVERVKEIIVDDAPSDPALLEPVKKTKKIRSQKQIEAFEKAKIKRAENIALKKKEKDTLRIEQKIDKLKTQITEEPTAVSIIDKLPVNERDQLRAQAINKKEPKFKPHDWHDWRSHPAPIINNYYYSGQTPGPSPTQSNPVPTILKENKKVTLKETSSEEEEDVYTEEELDELVYQQPPQQLKYKFV